MFARVRDLFFALPLSFRRRGLLDEQRLQHFQGALLQAPATRQEPAKEGEYNSRGRRTARQTAVLSIVRSPSLID